MARTGPTRVHVARARHDSVPRYTHWMQWRGVKKGATRGWRTWAAALGLATGCGEAGGVQPEWDGGTIPDAPTLRSDVPLLVQPSDGGGGAEAGQSCAKSEATATKSPVDFIISVDQSTSMKDDIANVKANINKLSDYLTTTGLDYRVVMIGQIGTSTYQVCVPPPLGVGSPGCGSNPPKLRTVNQLIGSHDTLQKIISTYDSKQTGMVWSDFIREDSIKAFVPITDDDATTYNAAKFDTELLKRGQGTFGTAAKRKYVAYPIMGAMLSDATKSCGANAENPGTQYSELAKLTKGKWYPICETDFGPVFTSMAKSVADTLACELVIPPPPTGEALDPEKVNVVTACGGTAATVPKDETAACDQGADGWQYSADKKRIVLCGDACQKVKESQSCKVTVEFGCGTTVRPPK